MSAPRMCAVEGTKLSLPVIDISAMSSEDESARRLVGEQVRSSLLLLLKEQKTDSHMRSLFKFLWLALDMFHHPCASFP